jgi:hypothetical protein
MGMLLQKFIQDGFTPVKTALRTMKKGTNSSPRRWQDRPDEMIPTAAIEDKVLY